MGNLVDFAARIDGVFTDSSRQRHWSAEEAERYMAKFSGRRERFESLAASLMDTVIRPRVEVLVGHFTNASLGRDDTASRCTYWFGYCERFPASTKVEFVIEHDARYEKAVLRYHVHMMPVFIKLTEHDSLAVSIDSVDEGVVASWVEERLLEFLDDYLRIDRGDPDLHEEAATDPVCGMQIDRTAAAGSESYLGHPYYFCSDACQQQFAAEPKRFVQLRNS